MWGFVNKAHYLVRLEGFRIHMLHSRPFCHFCGFESGVSGLTRSTVRAVDGMHPIVQAVLE